MKSPVRRGGLVIFLFIYSVGEQTEPGEIPVTAGWKTSTVHVMKDSCLKIQEPPEAKRRSGSIFDKFNTSPDLFGEHGP